jgi:hypothetical protein
MHIGHKWRCDASSLQLLSYQAKALRLANALRSEPHNLSTTVYDATYLRHTPLYVIGGRIGHGL